MQISLEVFGAKLLTDKQTNNDENATSMAEVIVHHQQQLVATCSIE